MVRQGLYSCMNLLHVQIALFTMHVMCSIASCDNQPSGTSHTGRNSWFYTEKNYTFVFDGSQTSSLFINVSYSIQPQLLIWKHNGSILDFYSGQEQLLFHPVVPSDAGHYAITASSGAQCQTGRFIVLVECEYKFAEVFLHRSCIMLGWVRRKLRMLN